MVAFGDKEGVTSQLVDSGLHLPNTATTQAPSPCLVHPVVAAPSVSPSAGAIVAAVSAADATAPDATFAACAAVSSSVASATECTPAPVATAFVTRTGGL